MASLSPTGRARSANVFSISSPANSPGRPQRLIEQGILNENDPAYKSAMQKIYEASWKFDRGKNEDLLKTLDNRELLPDQFRQMLKSGMNCKFTNDEFDAVFPIFNNNGNVDGTEFIMLFYKFRYDHRNKLLSARVDVARRTREMEKAIKIKQAEDFENKRILELVTDFTPEDEKTALEKMVNAAVKYDRLMPGAIPLDAFDIERMTPGEFREQLKSVFNIQLSVRELSAFIAYFNRDKDPNDKCVNCAAFLVTFFRWGFKEKTIRLHEVWEKEKRINEEKEKKRREEQEELDKKNASKVNFTFTPEDKERAIKKLKIAAKLYDKTTPGAMSMKAFEVKEMPPHVFKEQLRRIFNLQVTPAEMGALMAVFDVNGDGVITCEEFTKVFINMGFEEREKELKEARERQKRFEEKRKEEEIKKKEELENKNASKVSFNYTEEEYNTAIQKLCEAAWRYDKSMPGAASLEAFETQYMEPHVLKDQLKKAFFMKVTPQELGAIMHYFDPEDSGRINCSQFLKKMFRVGYEERQRKKELWREHQKQLNERRLEEEKQKMHNLAMKNSIVLSASNKIDQQQLQSPGGGGDGDKNPTTSSGRDFTEKDFQSAFFKLTLGAIKYDRSLPNAMNLTAFECISMPPHIFREQLKLTFNVKVTVPELWALMSYFDKDNTGEINCKKFINQFLRTGYEERNRIKEQWRLMKLMKSENEKNKEMEMKQEKELLAFKECDFDFSENDFNHALYRFVYMCHTVDKRTIGPAGLVAFESESLNPSEFREMLKRTFNFKVNSRELGALVNYFDAHHKKCVHCATFLNTFTQIRAYCEDFKGKPNEQQQILKYVLQLKESYAHRMARNPSVDARPWRQQNTIAAFHGNKKVFKRKEPKPLEDALEKYRLRMFLSRKTGRLDLSTKVNWPVKPSSPVNSPPRSLAGSRKSIRSNPKPEGDGLRSPSSLDGEDGPSNVFLTADGGNNSVVDNEQPQPPLTLDESHFLNEDEGPPTNSLFADVVNIGGASRQLSVKDDVSAHDNNENDDLNNLDDRSVHSLHSMKSMKSMKSLHEEENINEIPKTIPPEKEIEFRLNVFPPDILKLKELRELWLANHRITTIPANINQLEYLTIFSLQNNLLESLPTQISDLYFLKKLFLQQNKLSFLPNLFYKCANLEELNLSNNAFTEFPEVVTRLPSLRILDLSNNSIKTLPKSLFELKSLQLLILDGNPIDSPPAILSKLPGLVVKGCPIPQHEKSARRFEITPAEEDELTALLKGRAAVKITSKLRRRKKKSSYL